jgi:hypothetical protein
MEEIEQVESHLRVHRIGDFGTAQRHQQRVWLRLGELQRLINLRHGASVRACSPICNPRRRRSVNVWRFTERYAAVLGAHLHRADIICHDEEDVRVLRRWLRLRVGRRCRHCSGHRQ